jgi:hypothetical protein
LQTFEREFHHAISLILAVIRQALRFLASFACLRTAADQDVEKLLKSLINAKLLAGYQQTPVAIIISGLLSAGWVAG